MRTILAYVLLLAGIGLVHAQGSKIDRIDIVGSGIFKTGKATETITEKDTPGGILRMVSSRDLVTETTTIQPYIGLEFGFEFQVFGKPEGQTVRLRSITLHPLPGLRNPNNGQLMTRGEVNLTAQIGAISYRGYKFDHEWEMVPGMWTLELWDGPRKLVSQSYHVVQSGPLPQPAPLSQPLSQPLPKPSTQ
jgi:Domain of unknown function (DUF3859)